MLKSIGMRSFLSKSIGMRSFLSKSRWVVHPGTSLLYVYTCRLCEYRKNRHLWNISSVGQSYRLITGWSKVRILDVPPMRYHYELFEISYTRSDINNLCYSTYYSIPWCKFPCYAADSTVHFMIYMEVSVSYISAQFDRKHTILVIEMWGSSPLTSRQSDILRLRTYQYLGWKS